MPELCLEAIIFAKIQEGKNGANLQVELKKKLHLYFIQVYLDIINRCQQHWKQLVKG